MRSSLGIVGLVVALATACGASGTAGAGGGAATSVATNQAAALLASKLGIPGPLVDLALEKARSLLGGGADKAAAAQAGVDVAAAQAQAQGSPLAEEQKSGLLEGLKNLL